MFSTASAKVTREKSFMQGLKWRSSTWAVAVEVVETHTPRNLSHLFPISALIFPHELQRRVEGLLFFCSSGRPCAIISLLNSEAVVAKPQFCDDDMESGQLASCVGWRRVTCNGTMMAWQCNPMVVMRFAQTIFVHSWC